MDHQTPRELLEKTHQFPGRFAFKAIGVSSDDFAERVVATVRLTLGQQFDAPYQLRETSSGRHVAVTIEAWVESSDQVMEVFAAIRSVEGLVMLM
jgi:putative lipoic acid-binding regulatory protein